MIAAWAAGDDTDGTGTALAEHLRWQPWFWRLVRREIGHPHLAEDLPALAGRLQDDPAVVELPDRLGLFGATRIPQTLLTVLTALAARREVALYLPHPSPQLWNQVAHAIGTPTMRPRSSRPALRLGHPLLASLSRDVQDLRRS